MMEHPRVREDHPYHRYCELEELTLKELRAMAKEEKIENYSKLSKEELAYKLAYSEK